MAVHGSSHFTDRLSKVNPGDSVGANNLTDILILQAGVACRTYGFGTGCQ